jgi:type VI secretion system secreted protein Hcp
MAADFNPVPAKRHTSLKEFFIMATDMFMRIEGVSGESKDANHKDWTDIVTFSWGASQPGSMVSGGGGGVGKASFNDLNVSASIDKAAPAILKNCISGKHLSKVEISVCKAGGQQIEYTRITLEEVLVTGVNYTGDPKTETLNVQYAFQAAKVKQQCWEQTDKGGKGAETQVGWNIKENKEA